MLKAGAGRSDITPPVGIAHAGWGAQTHQVSEGNDMPLYVTALALSNADLQVAIVDIDDRHPDNRAGCRDARPHHAAHGHSR